MARFDFTALTDPVAPGEPCGPDLDLAGDPDFLNAIARADGALPTAFFTRDEDGRQVPFDRATIDFAGEYRALDGLLARTRDLRALTVYARLLALDHDLPGFAACLDGIVALLRARWDEVHPRGEAGDFELRTAVLQALDDGPSVVLPLQHLPLARSRRHGAISLRSALAAAGEVRAETEDGPDAAAVERAFAEAEPAALLGLRDALGRIMAACEDLRALTIERGGFERSVALERLAAAVRRILALVEPVIGAREPAGPPVLHGGTADEDAAPADGVVPGAGVGSDIVTGAGAAAALGAAIGYFAAFEPSSPAAILLAQAQQLIGKSFVEVLRILVPAHAERARLAVGAGRQGGAHPGFDLTFEQLSSAAERGSPDVREAPQGSEAVAPPATRGEAIALSRRAAAFYRRAEPASPIPLLIERACGLAEQDFLAILRDVLPGALLPRDAND